jgi:hypothetical protein
MKFRWDPMKDLREFSDKLLPHSPNRMRGAQI